MRKALRLCAAAAVLAALLISDAGACAAYRTPLEVRAAYGDASQDSGSAPYIKKERTSVLVGASGAFAVYRAPQDCEITYQSSDESILSVKKGERENICEYTGVSPGKATVSVKIAEPVFLFISNTVTLKMTVDVTPKAASIKFKKDEYQIKAGKNKKLKYTLRPSITDEIPYFHSSNEEVANVTPKGKLIAKSKGVAYITASISNGCFDRCRVVVK